MKSWLKKFAVAAALGCAVIMPSQADAASIVVPDTIYGWVQSSSRMNYFFNKQEIKYGTDMLGRIDLHVLKVPVIKTYDAVQIEDVLEKRKWNHEDVDGYGDLAGEAGYLTIALTQKSVTVDQVALIDSQLWTPDSTKPAETMDITKMAPKNKETIFYNAILDYEAKHRFEIAAQTKGELKESDAKMLEKERKAMEKAERQKYKDKK